MSSASLLAQDDRLGRCDRDQIFAERRLLGLIINRQILFARRLKMEA